VEGISQTDSSDGVKQHLLQSSSDPVKVTRGILELEGMGESWYEHLSVEACAGIIKVRCVWGVLCIRGLTQWF